MEQRGGGERGPALRGFVLDREALLPAVCGDRETVARSFAARGEAEVASPVTSVGACGGRIAERRRDPVLSRFETSERAKHARRPLADAELHGHAYAIGAVLAAVPRRGQGCVTVLVHLRSSRWHSHGGRRSGGCGCTLRPMTKPYAPKRHLPTSPFAAPSPPAVKHFVLGDQVTHDVYGLGRVVDVEEGVAALVDFGSARVRVLSPYAKMIKL